MTVGAISFQPYVFSVNAISPASMNKLSRISDDVLDQKTDFSGLAQAENENPLKKGQTLHFQDMLEMQMQRGRSNAARMMKSRPEESRGMEQPEAARSDREDALQAQSEREKALENVQNVQTAAFDGSSAGSGVSSFRMQQAISAYEMFMTA